MCECFFVKLHPRCFFSRFICQYVCIRVYLCDKYLERSVREFFFVFPAVSFSFAVCTNAYVFKIYIQ